jgi:hypothetical protein
VCHAIEFSALESSGRNPESICAEFGTLIRRPEITVRIRLVLKTESALGFIAHARKTRMQSTGIFEITGLEAAILNRSASDLER